MEEQHSLIQALFTSIRSSIVSMEVEKIKAMVAREEEINGSQATVAVLTYSSGEIRRIEKISQDTWKPSLEEVVVYYNPVKSIKINPS